MAKKQVTQDLSLSDEEINNQLEETSSTQEDPVVAPETPSPVEEAEAQSASKEQDHFIINEAENDQAKWYVIHSYSGHEARVAKTLIQRVQALHLEGRFFEIFLPSREKIEIKSGKREKVQEKIFPGYILIRMILDDDTWHACRTTQGITGFVGTNNKPTPISPAEVATIRKYTKQAPVHKAKFSKNEAVKIINGPFTDFLGTISEIDEAKGKLKVLVSMFGRETPVELDFLQVAKV